MQLKKPLDLVISTGKSYSVRDFLVEAMQILEIDFIEIKIKKKQNLLIKK